MNKAVAYCRVSTKKEEQIDSLHSQEQFFRSYCERQGLELIRVYADEGKSGTKLKNRTSLLQLLADANKNKFQVVLIKDVSRLARNTVDFLVSIRKLKSLGVEVLFVNYDQTSSQSSEFMLTMLSAIAQEESSNTSKRVKFGKKENAKNGRVPNLVYGYDKIPKNYFSLRINEEEAQVVRDIFYKYTEQGYGSNRIAKYLNAKGIKTKRDCTWTQNGVGRIIKNPIYIGVVTNGKEEVEDFLSGKRRRKDEEEWFTVQKEELRIVSDRTFQLANLLLEDNRLLFQREKERQVDSFLFSRLIRCGICNCNYRRISRKYKNLIHRWVCSTRNLQGVDACGNDKTVNEDELLDALVKYIYNEIGKESKVKVFVREVERYYKEIEKEFLPEVNYQLELSKCYKKKEKYINLYENDIISMEDLKRELKEIEYKVKEYEEMQMAFGSRQCPSSDGAFYEVVQEFKESLSKDPNIIKEYLSNDVIQQLVEKIVVEPTNKVNIYFKR